MMKSIHLALQRSAFILGILLIPAVVLALNIDSTYKYAWGENIGWVNFGTTEGDVDVSTSAVDGYAWGENVGWISLTCDNTSSCGTVNYGISRSGDALSGYAWGENVGWISFACENTSSCGTVDYGVEVDSATGDFSGYAWGENVGWLNFSCDNDSSCGVVDFKVKTSATATPTPTTTSTPAVPPISLGSPTPTPPVATATPTALPSGTPLTSPTTSPTPVVSATPTTTPPISTPSTSPRPTPPVESPRPEPIEVIGRGIDAIGEILFGGGLLRSIADACDDDLVEAGACASTAVSAVIALLGIIAMLLQQEVAAATFSLLQIVGLKKKAKVWGTIYDVKTKRPVPLAKVELFDANNRLLETRYADRDGRYGFLLSPAMLNAGEQTQISIRAGKPGYEFPSRASLGQTDYFVYDHLYQGGPITVRSDSVLLFNIPMDPTGGMRTAFSGFGRSLTGPLVDRILNFGFYAGLILVPLNLYLVPNAKNLIILIVFLFANLFRLFAHFRPYGTTIDVATGKHLPFALVTLNEPDGRRVAFAVSDEFGRYILSAEKQHEYELVAHTPANISPQRETRERITLRSGWMTQTIQVGKNPLPGSRPPTTPIHSVPPPQSSPSTGPTGLGLSALLVLFAVGFATGRPRLPIGAVGEGVDEAYATLHPYAAALSDILHENTPIIEIMATVATATVVAGAALAAREVFRDWMRGRRGTPNSMSQTIGTAAFLVGATMVPMLYLFSPTTGHALLGVLFLSATAVWAHTRRIANQ